MTKEQAIKKIQAIIDCDLRELNTMPQHEALQNEVEALDMAIKALETVEEFEKAQIITGGRLNGRTYAYKCGLEDGKRKALEQQSSDDCVRVLNRVMEYTYGMLTTEKVGLQHLIKSMIEELPSVTPTRKVGKWKGEEEGYYSECSCCGASFLWEDYKCIGDWKYCPKCGAEMRGVENE